MVDDEDGPGGVEVYIEFPDENPYETPPLEYVRSFPNSFSGRLLICEFKELP